MKIKLGNLVNAKEALNIISLIKFPASKLFDAAKFLELANKEIQDFEKVRTEKVKQYGVERINDDGETITEVPKDKVEEFIAEINELAVKEIEFSTFPAIYKSEFITHLEKDGIEISAKDLLSINWLLEDIDGN